MSESHNLNASQRTNSSFTSHERRFFFGEITQEVLNISEEDNINCEERTKRIGEIIDRVESEAPSVNNNNSLFSAGDYYLHSRVLKDVSELTKRCTEQVTGEVNNYDKFALAQSIANNPDFWDFTFPNEVPAVSYLFGTFAPTPLEERPRVPRRRAERQRAGDLKAPQKLDQVAKKADEGTERVQKVLRWVARACKNGPVSYFHVALDPTCFTRTIENIYDLSFLAKDGDIAVTLGIFLWHALVLRWVARACKNGPVSYFHVALDPTCFTRTIENIYDLSFLAKDGDIAVTLDEKTGLPVITRVGGAEKRRAEGIEANHFVISMDMQRWRDLTQAFDIRKPLMRT